MFDKPTMFRNHKSFCYTVGNAVFGKEVMNIDIVKYLQPIIYVLAIASSENGSFIRYSMKINTFTGNHFIIMTTRSDPRININSIIGIGK